MKMVQGDNRYDEIQAKEVSKKVDAVLKKIEKRKRQIKKKGISVHGITKAELVSKFKPESCNYPFISHEWWTSGGRPGDDIQHGVVIYNPGPNSYFPVFVSTFFGPSNFLNDVGDAMGARDLQWPYISDGPVFLGIGESHEFVFRHKIPDQAVTGIHHGNAIAWVAGFFGTNGLIFDRGNIWIKVASLSLKIN